MWAYVGRISAVILFLLSLITALKDTPIFSWLSSHVVFIASFISFISDNYPVLATLFSLGVILQWTRNLKILGIAVFVLFIFYSVVSL